MGPNDNGFLRIFPLRFSTYENETMGKNKALIEQYDKLLKSYKFQPTESVIRSMRQDLAHKGLAKTREDSAVFAVVRVICQQTTMQIEEIRLLTSVFKQYSNSRNVDGLIDKKSFEACCYRLLHINNFLIDQLFRVLDTRGEQMIDYHDFVVGLAVFISGFPQSKVEMLFKIIDSDKNGLIEYDELKRMFKFVLSQNSSSNMLSSTSPSYQEYNTSEEYIDNMVKQIFISARKDLNGPIIPALTLKDWRKIYDSTPHLIQIYNHFMLQTFSREMAELGM